MQACNMLGLILREQALWLTVSLMVAGGGASPPFNPVMWIPGFVPDAMAR